MSPARSSLPPLGLAVSCCVLLLACDAHRSEASRLRTDIEPFLDEHARFDRWARRMEIAESAFSSREALQEAAFAPLRDRRRVIAAWLVREGPDATELRYPEGAPPLPEDGWVRVRLPEHALEEVYAQRTSLQIGGEARSLILMRRTQPAPSRGILHVTLAF